MKSGTVWAKGTIPLVIDCQHIQFADYTAAQVRINYFSVINLLKNELAKSWSDKFN